MGARGARPAGDLARRRHLLDLSAMGGALARPCRQSAPPVPPGRAGGDRDDQSPGIPRSAVRNLARRPGRRADERQAPRRGVRLHHQAHRRRARSGEPRPRRGCRAARPHHRDRQRRVAAALSGRRHRPRPPPARRSRLALLHQRHHRPPQGGDADASHPDGAEPRLFRRDRAGRRRRLQASRRAAIARLRRLRTAFRRHGRQQYHSGKRRFRSGRDRCASCPLIAMSASSPRRPW